MRDSKMTLRWASFARVGLTLVLVTTATAISAAGRGYQDALGMPDALAPAMVRMTLSAEFGDAAPGTVVYLLAGSIRGNWLPDLPGVEFRLLTGEQASDRDERGEDYYFFGQAEPKDGGYRLALLHGTACNAWGAVYEFRIEGGELQMRKTELGQQREC